MEWYALQTHTSFESQVAGRLDHDGIRSYWPSREVLIRHAREKQTVRRSLFPGYLFAQFEDRRQVLSTPHLVRVVGYGDHPVAIPSTEIEGVRILADQPTAEPCSFFTTGQPVYIKYGPLAGVYGSVVRAKGKQRVIVSVSLIAQAVSAEVEGDWLELRKAA